MPASPPSIFELDDENRSNVIDPSGASAGEDAVRQAAETCPMTAVILEDDEGNQIFP